jgi:hypothetical protein
MMGALNARSLRRAVTKRVPVLNWLPHYKPSTAVADIVAGVTVGLTLIPQAIAYASLAGLYPQVRAHKHGDRLPGLPCGHYLKSEGQQIHASEKYFYQINF